MLVGLLSSRLPDRTQNPSERHPDHLEADVKRLLLFYASTVILLCLLCPDKPTGLLSVSAKSVIRHRTPSLVLASLRESEGSYQNAVAPQGNGNQFGVDFTFNGRDGSAPTAALIQDTAGNL